jgi:hypothetical protein
VPGGRKNGFQGQNNNSATAPKQAQGTKKLRREATRAWKQGFFRSL